MLNRVIDPSGSRGMAQRKSVDIRRAKSLFKVALLVMVITIALGFYKGQFGDEDEKIAAVIASSHGASLYGDQLINHGPLPFLLAGLGYKLGGPFGSLTGLRILPALLALLSVCLLGSTPLLHSPLLRAYGALTWTIFLSIFWNVKTIHMGIYHGIGGLLGAILVVGILLPLYMGDRRFLKLACWGFVIGILLLLSSVTFAPLALSLQTSLLAFWFLSSSREHQETNMVPRPREGRLYRRISDLAASIALIGIISFVLLCIVGIIDLKGLYYGHIYFNQFIFAKLASPLNLFLVIFRSQDALWINLLRVALFSSLLILPVWMQYLRPDIRRPLLYSLATVPATLGIASLSYRVGIGSVSFFTGLPYLLPVTALSILSCLIIVEQMQHAGRPSNLWIVIRRCLLSAPAGLLVLFGGYRFSDPEFGRATIDSFSAVRHSLADQSLARVSNERDLVSRLIDMIERQNPSKTATLFAWPFNPVFFALHDRPSAFPANWFLWYNELVEKDRILARYHVCRTRPKLEDYPDIISYSRILIFGLDSQKYGQCLLALMRQHYIRISDDIYLRKDHEPLLKPLYSKHPRYQLLSKVLVPLNWPKNKDLPTDFVPVALLSSSPTSFPIKAERDADVGIVGLRMAVFNTIHHGKASLCLSNLSQKNGSCSAPVDMSNLRDNEVARFVLDRPLSLSSGDRLSLTVSVQTQISSSHNAGKNIAILLLPALKSPIVFVGM